MLKTLEVIQLGRFFLRQRPFTIPLQQMIEAGLFLTGQTKGNHPFRGNVLDQQIEQLVIHSRLGNCGHLLLPVWLVRSHPNP